jgi:hypothetical protein
MLFSDRLGSLPWAETSDKGDHRNRKLYREKNPFRDMRVDQTHSTLHQGCSMEEVRERHHGVPYFLLPTRLAAPGSVRSMSCNMGAALLKQANHPGGKGRKERLKNVLSHTPSTYPSSNFGQMRFGRSEFSPSFEMPGYCVAMWSYRHFGDRNARPICQPKHRWSLNAIIRQRLSCTILRPMHQAMHRLFAQVAWAFEK